MKKIEGMGIALITPFKTDFTVDYEALEKLVEFQVTAGADFLAVLCTTAETPTLTLEERRKVRQVVTEVVRGRVPIVLGCGGNNTMAIVEELKTGDWTGVDAILSVVPYYNKPSQEGLYQHFKAIAGATKLPVVLYNVPGRTGINLKPETTCRLPADCSDRIC